MIEVHDPSLMGIVFGHEIVAVAPLIGLGFQLLPLLLPILFLGAVNFGG